jgi:putative membrane protein
MSDRTPIIRGIVYYTCFLFLYSLSVAWLYRSGYISKFPFSREFSAVYIVSVCIYIVAHAVLRIGTPRSAGIFSIGFIIPLCAEYIGVKSGFPFGDYHYTDLLGPRVLNTVPVVIPVIWSLMFYCVLSVTALWNFPPVRRDRNAFHQLLLRAVLGGFLMVSWDLVADPLAVSTGYWTWHTDGFYFGIPLSNFFGWFLTSFLVFVLYGLLDITLPPIVSRFRSHPWLEHLLAAGYFCAVANHTIGCFMNGLKGAALTGAVFFLVTFVPSIRGFSRIRKHRRGRAE